MGGLQTSEASVSLLWLARPCASFRDRAFELLLTQCVSSGFSQDSLAAEIEGTMRKELQLEEPESPDIAYGLSSKLPRACLVTCGDQNQPCLGLRHQQ